MKVSATAFMLSCCLPISGWAACEIRSAELPVYMEDLRPDVRAEINGKKVSFRLDSGAIYSMLSPTATEALRLTSRRADGVHLFGIGGPEAVRLTRVERFTLGRTTFEHVEFFVGGLNLSPDDSVGLLGQNFLGITDVEYDLANGVVRLHYPNADCKNARLAYWANETQAVSEVELEGEYSPYLRHLVASANIDGEKIRVQFDTGAMRSILSSRVAGWIGLKPGAEGVVSSEVMIGVGSAPVHSFLGPVKSFSIGQEKITNTRMRFGDVLLPEDMLIGADFFLSHRMYFAKSQRKLYFTYNGGPVFDLSTDEPGKDDVVDDESTAANDADRPKLASADAYVRRAAASVARRQYRNALADYTAASQLDPAVAGYFVQRATIYLSLRQQTKALAELNEAIRIDGSDLKARTLRARVHFSAGNTPAARDDLAALGAAVPPDSYMRLQLARLYLRMNLPEDAIDQLDRWIATHGDDASLAEAFNNRCWARALLGIDLETALADCDAALKRRPKVANYLDSRGLVYLRMGKYELAISDYDAALGLNAKIAWSLFGRGVARVRMGQGQAGQVDIAAAKQVNPSIDSEAARYGITIGGADGPPLAEKSVAKE